MGRKTGTTRLCALLAAAALLLGGCGVSGQDSYEVLGEVASNSAPQATAYDFPATLRQLYPTSDHVILGQVRSISGKTAQVLTVKVIEGTFLSEDDLVDVTFPEETKPELDEIYLLFLQEKDGKFQVQVDAAGLICVQEELLVLQSGSSISLTQALSDIDKIQNFVYIPSYFTYYRELDELVRGSSVVFTGTVISIGETKETRFYVREAGLEEITTSPSVSVGIAVQEFLKGSAAQQLQVILSDDMYANTTIESTFDQAAYSKENMPALEEGMQYLFFLVESPAGKHGSYYLFVNPFQGYVPLYSDETLIPIPINAPFSYMQDMESVRMDIAAILSGEYRSEEYDSSEEYSTSILG